MAVVRKSVNSLSAEERTDFVNAVKLLKKMGRYDWYVHTHVTAMNNGSAHQGPAFLPWHRQFLKIFESDIQVVLDDPTFGLPYWDSAADQSSGKPWTQWSIWGEDFMGGNGDSTQKDGVTTGPFRIGQWTTIDDPAPGVVGNLQRTFGVEEQNLPTPPDVARALRQTPYDAWPWNLGSSTGFRNFVEGWVPPASAPNMHNQVHVWVGGSMVPPSSPNDPVFFLHHANTDRLWSIWQAANPDLSYIPDGEAPTGHNLHDEMWPWNSGPLRITPADVLKTATASYESVDAPYIYWSLWGVNVQHRFGKWNYLTNKWDDLQSNWDMQSVAVGRNGDIWGVGTQNNLGKWDPIAKAWKPQSSNWGSSFNSVAVDANNDLYGVNTQHHLGKRNPTTGNFDVVPTKWDLFMVAFDASNTMWCAGHDFNIGKYVGTEFQDQPQMKKPWSCIAFDAQGQLWGFNTPFSTLYTWDYPTNYWRQAEQPNNWGLLSMDFMV